MASTINASTSPAAIVQTADGTGILSLQTGNTTAVTIDASQNVGIGTASPSGKLHVESAGTNYIYTRNSASTGIAGVIFQNTGDTRSWRLNGSSLDMFDNSANATRMSIDSNGNLLFNSGYGSAATAYGCRAWVNFNGTGTVAIRSSGNVSSITDNGTGDYTVNITTAMPDTSYSVGLSVREDTSNNAALGAWNQIFRSSAAISTTSVRVLFANGFTVYDVNTFCVQIFR